MNRKTKIIGVIGSSAPSASGLVLAYEVGRLLAEADVALVTGGLGGVMEAASRGCSEADGLVLGILPGADSESANPYVGIAVPSGMGHARNVLVVQTAQALIAVEGALGTLSEIAIGLKTGRAVFLLGSTLQVEGAIHVVTPQQAVSEALAVLGKGSDGR